MFGEVIGKSLVSCFFDSQCIYIYTNYKSARWLGDEGGCRDKVGDCTFIARDKCPC